MRGNFVESVIGAVVLFVAASFLIFVENRTDGNLDGSYELVARFDNVTGLTVGSDVRLGGLKVGSVTAASLDPKTYQAIMRFSVDEKIILPEDTAAAVSAEGFLGGSFLALLPGGFEENLADGDEISETQDAIDLIGLVSKFIGSSGD